MVSAALVSGVNNISIWFKDTAGNITASSDFNVTYNEPAIPASEFYLSMDDAQINAVTHFQKDVITNELGKGFNTGNITAGRVGQINQAVNFTTNAYYDFNFMDIPLTNSLSIFAWVNISAPGLDSHIVGRWDGTSANDSYAFRVDSTGRLCLDIQTTASTGIWNTTNYKRVCSTTKVTFASWKHVGVIRNGGTVQFYIDNKLAGTDTVGAANFLPTTLGIRVGAQVRGANNSGVEGILDDMAIWDVVLTSTQVEAAYAKGLKAEMLASEAAPIDPAISPDHYWRFETGSLLLDSEGGLPFTANTGALSTAGGQVDGFFQFTAASSHVLTTTLPTTLGLGSDFTIGLWVNPTTLTASDILSKWSTTIPADQEFKISTTAGGLVTFSYQLTTPITGSISSIEALPIATWTHVAVARRGRALYLYLNGRPQAVADIGTDSLISVTGMRLSAGGNGNSNNSYFNGGIDDISIYHSYLQERKVRFNIDRGLLGDPVVP